MQNTESPLKQDYKDMIRIFLEEKVQFETPFANPTFNTLSNIAKALGKNLEVRLV